MSASNKKKPQWADLPTDLQTLILTKLNLVETINFGQVCKWWRSAVLRLHSRPPLLLSYFSNPSNQIQSLLCHSPGRQPKLSVKLDLHPDGKPICVYGPSEGCFFIRSSINDDYLLNPTSQRRVYLPNMNTPWSVKTIALSSSPNSNDCIVVAEAKSKARRILVAWRNPGQNQWTSISTRQEHRSLTFFEG